MIPVIPVIPSLALALFSFISSVFVILRTLLPILPAHPLSRRVPRSAFGLPRRSLSPAQRSTVYIAVFDIVALVAFLWQVSAEYLSAPSAPATAARLWFALTARQTFLLIVATFTLWNVRRGHSVYFGIKDFYVWGSAVFLVVGSTACASAFAGIGWSSLYEGLVIYSSSVALLTTAAFACLFGSLLLIRRNLAAQTPWPPAAGNETRIITPVRRPGSFATEDIEELKEGASWITSRHSGHTQSLSTFSFTTHSSTAASSVACPSSQMNPFTASDPSLGIPRKSSYWFTPISTSEINLLNPTPATKVPPVPPLPSPYAAQSSEALGEDPDPFRKASPPRKKHSVKSRSSSWLTSPSASVTTLSQWSFPATRPASPPPHILGSATSPTAFSPSPRPSSEFHEIRLSDEPLISNSEKYVSRRYQEGADNRAEKGNISLSSNSSDGAVSLTFARSIGWLFTIWVPLSLSLPYLLLQPTSTVHSSPLIPVLLILSVTLSAPLLALHVVFSSPLPFSPSAFLSPAETPSLQRLRSRSASPADTSASGSLPYDMAHKNPSTVTFVESRKSGDVWMDRGDAVDGKGKLGRALGMLTPVPKLAVLPPDEPMDDDVSNYQPESANQTPTNIMFPLSVRNSGFPTREELERYRMSSDPMVAAAAAALARSAARKAEIERESMRKRKESKASSVQSVEKTRIMIAERHVSAMAMTVVMPKSPVASEGSWSSSVARKLNGTPSSHLRSRSASSIAPSTNSKTSQSKVSTAPVTPPPSFPLPPTPPSVRRLRHVRSQSSGVITLGGATSEFYDIDNLSAAIKRKKGTTSTGEVDEVEELIKAWATPVPPLKLKKESSWKFESPETHSTPVQQEEARRRRESRHKRAGHYSLPSLGLSTKDGSYSLSKWRAELERALGFDFALNISGDRRRTVWGGESAEDLLNSVAEEGPKAPVLQELLPPAENANKLSTDTGLTHGGGSTTPYDRSIMTPSPTPTDRFIVQQATEPKEVPAAQPTAFVGKTKAFHLPQRSSSRIKYIKASSDDYESDGNNIMPDRYPDDTRPVQDTYHEPRPILAHPINSPLRPLSLLQGKNLSTPTVAGTPPLKLAKKKSTNGSGKKKENVNSTPASKLPRPGMKPLQLVRSATSKARGILREEEILPDVVVRPPSESIHNGFVYTFR